VLLCCFKADARLRIQNQILESTNATDFQNFFPYLSSRTRRLGKQHKMAAASQAMNDGIVSGLLEGCGGLDGRSLMETSKASTSHLFKTIFRLEL
jgi:hypothetical protein